MEMPKRLLELFAGTGSVGKVFEAAGWEVVSVDSVPAFGPTICVDIMRWDYRIYPPGHFDFVHASPPCTEFSRALTTRPRDLEAGDVLVDKTLEILTYFRPPWWTIENPHTGYMKTRANMLHLKTFMRRVCYCMYCPEDDDSWAYRKDTAIWTNLDNWTPRPLCTKATPCKWKQGGAHPRVAQRGGGSGINAQNRRSQSQLYSMPPPLMEEWLDAVTEASATTYQIPHS